MCLKVTAHLYIYIYNIYIQVPLLASGTVPGISRPSESSTHSQSSQLFGKDSLLVLIHCIYVCFAQAFLLYSTEQPLSCSRHSGIVSQSFSPKAHIRSQS